MGEFKSMEGIEQIIEDKQTSERLCQQETRRRGVISRALWVIGGFICFGLGMLGAFLPFLPTVPFLLAAAFFFGRSSQRLDRWFRSTRLYCTVLEGYARKRAMTLKAKLAVLLPVTSLLSLSFVLMVDVPLGRMLVVLVWIGHIVYFGFVVRTEKA